MNHSYSNIFFKASILGFSVLMTGSPCFAIDCKQASTSIEKTICQDEDLRQSDEALSKLYAAIVKQSNDAEKKLLTEGEKAWIKERDSLSSDNLLSFYRQRLHYLSERYKGISKPMVVQIINDWKNQPANKTFDPVSSIIVSSYLKGNVRDYISDQNFYNDLNTSNVEWSQLFSLDPKTVLVQVGINLAAYQGESISFLFKDNDFSLIKFPQYDFPTHVLLTELKTQMSDMVWTPPTLTIHERSNGFLYECGMTYTYRFSGTEFVLTKQIKTPCDEKEIDAIQSGKLKAENLKTEIMYPK